MITEENLKKYFAVSDDSAKEIALKLKLLHKVKMHPRPRSASTTLNIAKFIRFLYPGMNYDQEFKLVSWTEVKKILDQLPGGFSYRLHHKNGNYTTIRTALDIKRTTPYLSSFKIVEDNLKNSNMHALFSSIDWEGWKDNFTNVYTDAYTSNPLHSWVKDVFETTVKLWVASHIEQKDTDTLRLAFSSIADGTVPFSVCDPTPEQTKNKIKPHTIILSA